MYKVQFDIIHKGCWGSEISSKFPGMNFSSIDVRWVKGDVAHILVADLLKVKGNPQRFDEVITYLKRRKSVAKVEVISVNERKIYVRTLTRHTQRHKQFSDHFFDNNLFMIAPVRFEDGYEKWILGTTDKKNISKVYNLLSKQYKVKISSIKEENAGEDLTNKQREALTYAKYFGYYEWPRKKGVTEISKLLKISKTVFLSHLRKAENKIICKFLQ